MSVGEVQVKLGLDTSAFSTALASAKMQALALGGSFDGIGKSLGNLGGGGGTLSNMGKALGEIATTGNLAAVAVAAIGIAAVTVGAQMARMAADYQSAMAKVGATTGQSNEKLKEMQDLMYKNTAQGSRLNMTQQAGIAAGLGGAGLIGTDTSAEEQLKLLRLTERAMVALEAPTDDVIDLFSVLQTRYGATTEEMEKSASSIAQMADETSASNAEIVQATLTMGRLAGTVKMTQPEMIALAAATKSSGIEAAEVGTQWGSMVKSLSSTSEGAANAFRELGMSQEDWFAALQESKNTGSNAPVLRFLGELDKRLQKSDNSAQQSMQLFGSYGMVLGGSIAQVIGKYDQLNQSSQKAYTEGVRLTAEYDRMTNTMNSMMDALGAKFDAIAVQMGTALLGPIQDATYQFDQFLGTIMQGDMGAAFYNLYAALFNYDWFGAGVKIVGMIASGLGTLAEATGQAVYQLANVFVTHDWIGSGRDIASRIVSGLSNIGSMARSALSDVSSWVSSGGARSAGENLANWVINGAQSIFGAGVDLLGWLRENLTMDKVSGIVRAAFDMTGELINIGMQAGSDFLSGISKAITDTAGGIWGDLTKTAWDLVDDFTKVGQALVNALTTGIATGINSALNPVITKVNEILGGINQYSSKLGVTMPTFEPISLSGTNYGGVGTDYGSYWEQTKSNFTGNVAQMFAGNSKISGNEELMQAAQYAVNNKNPYKFFEEAGAQGLTFQEAYQAFVKTGNAMTQNQPLNMSSAGQAWGQGVGKVMGGVALKEGDTGAATTTPSEKAATDAVKKMEETWSSGVVPVEVTNWPDGFGAGGVTAGGTKIAGVNSYGQTVDANGLPIGKFDASKINTSGPGIGMVATEGGKGKAYADRLEIDTCEIDSFGMTPGLGAELAASGAWRPNAGAASQKLAAEIGYSGDYTEPSQYGAIMGTMNQIVKTQNTTATKVSGITVGAATKATGITIGGMQQATYSFQAGTAAAAKTAGNTMEASARNAQISLEDGAYSCFNSYGEMALTWEQEIAKSVEEQKAGSVVARDNIVAGGQHVKENSLTTSLDFKNKVDTAGTDFKNNIASGSAAWGSALGSGLTSLSQIASYVTGGSAVMYGGGTTSAGNGITQTPWGAGSFGGTSIGGGGSWVGTGASYSGAGAMAVSGRGFTSSNGVRWFADGGIITKPSIVGVGEAGTEAIVPIGKLPEMVANIAGGSGSGGGHSHAIYIDGKKVADAVGPAMVKRMQQGAGLKVR